MNQLTISDVRFLEGQQLEISLSNGHKILYDMSKKIETARFMALKQKELFLQGRVIENRLIVWQDEIELSLDEILLNVSNERIYT